MGKRRRWTDAQLEDAVARSLSLAGALRLLGLRPGGGQYVVIRSHIDRLGISTAHWRGQGWRKGATRPVRKARPLNEVLVNGRDECTSRLKARLLRAGLFEPRCAMCGITSWLGAPAPLELDHRNGDRTDNRLENLQLLCPNCHALTPTYCGRNIGRASAGEGLTLAS